jgi:peptidoglycan/LPS O-acetylase OafA/YrhL
VLVPLFLDGPMRSQPELGMISLITVPTLTQGWIPAVATAWNPPAWSLSTEAFFYLLFPLLAPLLARVASRRLLPLSAAIYAAGLAVPATLLVVVPANSDAFSSWQRFVVFGPPSHLAEFVLGVILGIWFLRHGHQSNTPRARTALGTLAVIGLAGYVAAAYASDFLPRAFPGNGLFAPIYALLIYSLARSTQSLPARILALPIMTLLGEASYGLYLLHMPIVLWVAAATTRLPDGGASLLGNRWFGPLEILFAVGLSVAVFTWIEGPARRRLRSLLDPNTRTRRASVAVPARVPIAAVEPQYVLEPAGVGR